jgi:hypothetical protein
MVSILFSCASTFVLVNNTLSPRIHFFKSIRQGCPLAPYLYLLIANASICLQCYLRGLSLSDNSKMVNNHFVDDSLLFV